MSALLDYVLEGNQENDDLCGLTRVQRFIGFAATAVIGMFAGVLSIIAIALLRIRKFGILFTICNICVLSSTGFVVGFKRQLQLLFEQKRYVASIGMFVGMSTTLMFAFKWKRLIGVVLGIVVEFVSFLYYALSYVPYGQQCFRRAIGLG